MYVKLSIFRLYLYVVILNCIFEYIKIVFRIFGNNFILNINMYVCMYLKSNYGIEIFDKFISRCFF